MKTKSIKLACLFVFVFALAAAVWLFSSAFAFAAVAADTASASEVYCKAEGAHKGYVDRNAMTTDGLALSVETDVASGGFCYVGIKPSRGGVGQPASSTPSIGILLYNSADMCLAVEVYDGQKWLQLTATTELTGISPTDRITLQIRKREGEWAFYKWGLYINGNLFTGRATANVEGVAEGTQINPLAYINESEFSLGGESYFEIGTWDKGGSISVYKQIYGGEIRLLNRELCELENVSIVSAYNASSEKVALLQRELSGGKYTVSTLGIEPIEFLEIETAGGVRRVVRTSGETVIKDKDVAVSVSDGQSLLGGASFTVTRGGKQIQDDITIEYKDGKYLLWDIGDEISLSVSRAGFASKTVTVGAQDTSVSITLSPRAFDVTVSAFDSFAGEYVPLAKENAGVYFNGEVADGVEIHDNAGNLTLRFAGGKTENRELRVFGVSGYANAQTVIGDSVADSGITVYLNKIYGVTLTVQDENGTPAAGAKVSALGREFAVTQGVCEITEIFGDVSATVRADGYAPVTVLLTQNTGEINVRLRKAEIKELKVEGVEDGVTVRYGAGGIAKYESVVQNGKITLDEAVDYGDVLTAEINGYYVEKSVELTASAVLSAQKIYELTVRFTYCGEPVADTLITFDRITAKTDGRGEITVKSVGGVLEVLAAEGYAAVENGEINMAQGRAEVSLSGKYYTARVVVTDENGNRVSGARVEIGDYAVQKADGAYICYSVTGNQTVTVNGIQAGEVSDGCPEITVTLKNKAIHDESADKDGCGSYAQAASAAVAVAVISAAASIITIRKRKIKI